MGPIRVDDREAVRPFLDAEPVENAVVWQRVFLDPDCREVYADRLPPRAVLAVNPPEHAGDATGIALHATDPGAARPLLAKVPPGPAFLHLTDPSLLDLLRPRIAEVKSRPAWLYRLDPKDFVDQQEHEVRAVDPRFAPMIARIWEPDWPSEGYVRSRIETGPSFGVYVDGDLVGWDMTHFETDRVVMMGFLHVLDAHRGKGYAKSMGSALVKSILAHGKIPACHVFTDNAASIRLTEGLGFRKVKMQIWGDAVLR
jgi:RimJ/RimL family protein N-acetyltransferase